MTDITITPAKMFAFDREPPPIAHDEEVRRLTRLTEILREAKPDFAEAARNADIANARERKLVMAGFHDLMEDGTLVECKSAIDSLIDRVSTLIGSAEHLEDQRVVIEREMDRLKCKAGCHCDSCEAARSDEHHDRLVDGELIGGA